MPAPHRVAVLASPGVYPFDLGIPARVLGAADDRYEVATCTADGGPVPTSADFSIAVDHGPGLLNEVDTIIIPPFVSERVDRALPEEVSRILADVPRGTRMVSICTGAFVLAAAGRLNGRPATTHWALAGLFREWYPKVDLNPDVLFVDDGDVLTSAGAASGIDVCLHLIRKDFGSEVANRAARMCVVPPWRDGGQAQFIERPVLGLDDPGTGPARQWALERLSDPLTIDDLAAHARMSRRTFSRRFADEVGMSPGRWLIQQRIHLARHLLETTDLGVDEIAGQVGFGGGTSLREHLHAAIGVSPQAYRRTFRTGYKAVTRSA